MVSSSVSCFAPADILRAHSVVKILCHQRLIGPTPSAAHVSFQQIYFPIPCVPATFSTEKRWPPGPFNKPVAFDFIYFSIIIPRPLSAIANPSWFYAPQQRHHEHEPPARPSPGTRKIYHVLTSLNTLARDVSKSGSRSLADKARPPPPPAAPARDRPPPASPHIRARRHGPRRLPRSPRLRHHPPQPLRRRPRPPTPPRGRRVRPALPARGPAPTRPLRPPRRPLLPPQSTPRAAPGLRTPSKCPGRRVSHCVDKYTRTQNITYANTFQVFSI